MEEKSALHFKNCSGFVIRQIIYEDDKTTIYGKEMPFEGPKDISANLEEGVHTYDTGTETQERQAGSASACLESKER